MPPLHNLLKTLSELTKKDKENCVLWESDDFKTNTKSSYKEEFKTFADKIWFQKQGNRNLLKKLQEIQNKEIQNNNANLASSSNIAKTRTKVRISNKFSEKLRSKQELSEVKPNAFLQEELEFYNELSQLCSKKNGKKLEVPLPCDSVISFKKKAYKFEGICPPESELVVYYFFKSFFKIDYCVLKKTTKMLEKFVKEKFD
jgi:hypothetical protein